VWTFWEVKIVLFTTLCKDALFEQLSSGNVELSKAQQASLWQTFLAFLMCSCILQNPSQKCSWQHFPVCSMEDPF
jgi:hypothetical protein